VLAWYKSDIISSNVTCSRDGKAGKLLAWH